jgi:hypothetical protein
VDVDWQSLDVYFDLCTGCLACLPVCASYLLKMAWQCFGKGLEFVSGLVLLRTFAFAR